MQNNHPQPDWKEVQLKEICCTIFSGGTPLTKEEKYWNGDISWLSSGEIKKRYILDSDQKITQIGVDNSSTKLARKNDILIASAGQGNTRGNVAFCLMDTYINQSLISLRCDRKYCNEKFLFFNLMDRYNELRSLSDANSSRGSLTCEMMGKLPIYLPPLFTQQKIATILSAYDDLIENNNRRIRILEEMAQAIYREWFVNFRFPGHEGVRMVESDLGLVPEGWEVRKISEVCERIYSGGTPNTKIQKYWDGDIPWLSSGETRNRYIISSEKSITSDGVNNSSTRLVKAGTTIIASAGQGQTRGQTSLLMLDSYINQSVIALKADEKQISDLYLFYDLSGRYTELRQISDSNASRGSLTTKLFAEMKIVIPPKLLAEKFSKIISNHVNLILNITYKNANLRRTRDLLLPKLINGEIDVSELEILIPEERVT